MGVAMNREAGFTLMEMLVALALTSMIALAGSTLLVGTLRASDKLGNVTGAVNELDIAHTLMRDDFANMAVFSERFGRATASSRPFMSFVRDGWSHPGADNTHSSLLSVEYRFEKGALTRRAWLRPDPVTGTPFVDRELASGLSRVSAQYFDGRQWLPQWASDAGDLPQAIELRLEYADDDTLTELFVVGGGG